MNEIHMSPEQTYMFDLQGYLVLKNVVPQATIDAANAVLDRLEQMDPADYPSPVTLGQPRTANNLYISNVVELDPALQPFMHVPEVLGVIADTSAGPYRLNHTYVIYRWGEGFTGLHMGGTPLLAKCQYRAHSGKLYSSLTKAVFPLLPARAADGCFAVIPGSHKSDVARPWGNHPDENPPLVPVEADPGDAIVFTEALCHGSLVNTSGRERRSLYYCYSVGHMADWGQSFNLYYSDGFKDRLSPEDAALIALK